MEAEKKEEKEGRKRDGNLAIPEGKKYGNDEIVKRKKEKKIMTKLSFLCRKRQFCSAYCGIGRQFR